MAATHRQLRVAVAICGVALAAAGDSAAIWPFTGRARAPAVAVGDAADVLAQAIRIPTVNPPGDERRLAELFVELLDSRDVETKLVRIPSRSPAAGDRAAAWARLPGTGAKRPIVLLSHLDVVPADAAAWGHDPFAGIVKDGYVIGRGALDAKGVAVVHLLALAELARSGTTLQRDVILLATPDEETGGVDGSGFIVREARDLLHDAEYLLTEGGGIRMGEEGTPPVWGITVTEKSPCWLRIASRGTPGHSAAPAPDAAVPRLVAALDRVRRIETPVRVVPEVARMFASLAPLAPPPDAAAFSDLERSLASDEAFRSRFLSNRSRSALVRNTHSITVLRGSPRTNVMPHEAYAHVDARLLPGDDCDDFAATVRAAIAAPEVTVEPILAFPARSSTTDSALFRAIERVASEEDPGALVVAQVIGGFTDAHYFRGLGIIAYGFVPRWLSTGESRTIHGPHERISIENLERGARVLVRILETLDQF